MALPHPTQDSAALVTGASSGIGTELALELGRRGHNVVLVARSKDALNKVADQIRAMGPRAEVLPTDLSYRADRAGLVDRVGDLDLRVDILVNNAGFSTVGAVAESDPESEMRMLEVNVVAIADLCSRFLPGMVERNLGAVLNVASTSAFQPVPGQSGYGASKAFVLSYTESLSGELRGTGVRATVLCPGPVDTGFDTRAGFAEGEAEVLPSFMWLSAKAVAKAGIDGLAAGRMVVIPGVANRASSMLGHLAPRRLLVPLLARQHPGLRK